MTFSIATKKVEEALKSYTGDREKVKVALNKNGVGFAAATTVTFRTEELPKDFLQHLTEVTDTLSDKQRVNLNLAITGVSADTDMICTKPVDVHTMITSMRMEDIYNAEIEFNGRWYPVSLTSKYYPPAHQQEGYCQITALMTMVDWQVNQNWYVSSYHFLNQMGDPRAISGKVLLSDLGLRHLQQELTEYAKKQKHAAATANRAGTVVACHGKALARAKVAYSDQAVTIDLGTADQPKRVVIENELESYNQNAGRRPQSDEGKIAEMPFVRAFSMDLKRYLYIDVDDIKPYEFDRNAINSLVLPSREKSVISKLFSADANKLFGDVLKDKHGGMIILANGSSGVGKTLTAEIFAEMTEKPLYVMEMSELGIKVEMMEQNLEVIFRRVTKWKAVLLMDEADVFLAKRGEDLERSVIVGIFLRLMDYYKGLLFLTSNRAEVIDPAFKSRITIKLDYPDLSNEARKEIWKIMMEKAGIKVTGGLDGIPEIELNGRQIRNMVRLIQVLHGNRVTVNEVKEVCQFACK